ncbi:MAG: M81 family metallopeptidase [Pseudomonadota bacterium]|nr:M81 family metallopeptidase [Pseudomonadota bacterium]
MKRVGILSLLQESNTFISRQTSLKQFEEDLLLEGEPVRNALADAHHEVGGFFAGLQQAGLTAVPLFAARALPYGMIESNTFDQLMSRMFARVDDEGVLDAYLVAPHGATVSASHADADGHWLSRLRTTIGPQVPVVGTLDLHANLSSAMVSATDALIAYRSNPHVDQRERGIEAATLLARTLAGEVRPVQCAAFPSFVMNIERQATEESPCRELYDAAAKLRRRTGLLSTSILQGFPYADVAEMGSATIAVTNGDAMLAEKSATELATAMWDDRYRFTGSALNIEQALDTIEEQSDRVCLLDMGDNVGGGSPADATTLAHALVRRGVSGSFVCLFDPEAVAVARRAGTGSTVTLSMGGKTDRLHGKPLEAKARIRGFYDGRFTEDQARHGGITQFDQGDTAIVTVGGHLTVMLTSRRAVPWSLGQFACCDLDPRDFHVLVAKGVNSPLAAYSAVCSRFIRVNTPGVTASDLSGFDYRYRRRPMFPFEVAAQWRS